MKPYCIENKIITLDDTKLDIEGDTNNVGDGKSEATDKEPTEDNSIINEPIEDNSNKENS